MAKKLNIWGLRSTTKEKCNDFALRNESKAAKNHSPNFLCYTYYNDKTIANVATFSDILRQ